MRLEIDIPDNTPPDLKTKLTSLMRRLSTHPELVEELMPGSTEPFPDYLRIMDQALESPNRFRTGEQVDAYISALRSEW